MELGRSGACHYFGALSLAWGVYVSQYCMGFYENRWIKRRLKTEFARRPDCLVDPHDPNAVYVCVIPREHFIKVKMTLATDLFLMRLDPHKRELLLEGDCNRYRIPAGAILECGPECFYLPFESQHRIRIWIVRLVIRAHDGDRELLLSISQEGWKPRTNETRQRVAEKTCREILSLGNPELREENRAGDDSNLNLSPS